MEIACGQDLTALQKALNLVSEIYQITQNFPQPEICTLTSQLRKASVSVPTNIAKGWGMKLTGDYINCLKITENSLSEIETLLIMAANLNNIDRRTLEIMLPKTQELHKMLNALIDSLQKSISD